MIVNAVPGHNHRAILAIENLIRLGQILIERRRQRNQFERRARLVNRADRTVHARFRFRIIRRIRIELRPVGQRQNRTVIRILYNHRSGKRVSLGNGLRQFSFGDVLNFFVDRQNNVRALILLRDAAIERVLPRVLQHHNFFGFSANRAVQLVFNSAESLFIQVHEPEDV